MKPLARLRRNSWLLPAAVLGILLLAAIFAPWIAPQNPYDLAALRLEDGSRPPAWVEAAGAGSVRYLMGTDLQGRDVFSAVLYGLRVSLLVGVASTVLAAVAGVALGLVAGYKRGWIDTIIMRLADVQLSFPTILIALFLMALTASLDLGLWKIVFAVAIVHWVIYARTVRGAALAEREKDYISAIRALGARTPRILAFHLLPNLLTPILVISAVQFA